MAQQRDGGSVTPLPGTSWQTEDGGSSKYSVEQFYTESTEGGGFHGSLRVNVKPTVQKEMSVLVQSGKIPQYRTIQDIARDAIHHRLHWIANHYGVDSLKAVMAFETRRQISARLRQLLADQVEMVDGYEEALNEALKAKDTTLLVDQLEQAREALEEDGLPWRPSVRARLKEIVDRFEGDAETMKKGKDA